MKRIKVVLMQAGLVIILLFLGSGEIAKADTLSSQGRGLYEYTDVEIGGRQYSYILYYENLGKQVSLISLKSKDDTLYIPGKIGDMTVLYVGIGIPLVNADGSEITSEDVRGTDYRADIPWQDDLNSEKKEVVVGDGVRHVFLSGFANSRIDTFRVSGTVRVLDERSAGLKKGKMEIRNLILEGNDTDIGASSFGNCGLETVKWPEDFCGMIEDYAFCNNENLKEIRWPAYKGKKLKNCMGVQVFRNCYNLKKVTFPKKMEHIYIPENCFYYCTKLKKLTFPASTKKVTYSFQTYAESHKVGVRTLQFNGKKTKLKGAIYYYGFKVTKKKLLTASRVVAPKNSYAIKFAKKAKRIQKVRGSEFGKSHVHGTTNLTQSYSEEYGNLRLSKVTCSYLKK